MPYQPPDVPTPESLRRVERPPHDPRGPRRRRRDVVQSYPRRRQRTGSIHPLSAAAAPAPPPAPTEEWTTGPATQTTKTTRPTRRQILAAVRAAYPDETITRNDPRVIAAIRNDAHRGLYIEAGS
jgi:hypothetical protein